MDWVVGGGKGVGLGVGRGVGWRGCRCRDWDGLMVVINLHRRLRLWLRLRLRLRSWRGGLLNDVGVTRAGGDVGVTRDGRHAIQQLQLLLLLRHRLLRHVDRRRMRIAHGRIILKTRWSEDAFSIVV